MPRPRLCSHTDRTKDGRCVLCTRKRQREYHRKYRAQKRELAQLSGQAVRRRGLTMEELLGTVTVTHDLL